MSKSGFKELQVWQNGKALAVDIYKLTSERSISRHYALVDQLRRCAVSIPSNIAEGDERGTDRDSIGFFYIAKGSLAELITQLEIAREIGALTDGQTTPLVGQCQELGRKLGALIKARSQEPPAHRPSPIAHRRSA